MFACQSFEKRRFRYPFEFPEQTNILGQEIVLDNASILRLVLADNRVITVVKELGSLRWFSPLHVECAFLFNDLHWDAEADHLVDLPLTSSVELVVGMLTSNAITKKLGCMGSCMRNQGLFF